MQQNPKKENVKIVDFQYKNKLKSAVYAFILFIVLSNKVSYKILDLIVKMFSQNIEVMDETETPIFLGVFIMAVIISVVIFLFWCKI